LHEHVGRLLPAYMVPRRYHRLPDLPRNANGKTDRRRLAELVD
jgi:acyl-coenzyme A synthetase/AMP-(fatty) acid ligase